MNPSLGRNSTSLFPRIDRSSVGRPSPEEAITPIRKKSPPKPDINAYRNRFDELRKNGQIETIHMIARRALQTWPDELFFQIQIGNCLVLEERLEEADEHWQKLREAKPDLVAAYMRGSAVKIQLGRHTEAAALLNALIAMGNLPENVENNLDILSKLICREDILPTQTHLLSYVRTNDTFRQAFQVENLPPANKLVEQYTGDEVHLNLLKSITPGWFTSFLTSFEDVTIFPYSFEKAIHPQRVMEHIAYTSDGKPIPSADHHKRVYRAFVDHRDKGKLGAADLKTEERPVVYCGSFIPHHGHFIVEILPRLWTFLQQPQLLSERKVYFNTFSRREEIWKNPTYIFEKYHGDYLTALGVSPDQVAFVRQPTLFKDVIVSSPATSISSIDCFASKEATLVWRALNQRMSDQWREASGDRQPPRKIYISRRRVKSSVSERVLENEVSLEQLMNSMGYEVVFPEELASEMQKQFILSKAEIVVGLSGSGLLNTVFSPPDAKIVCVDSDSTMKITCTVQQQIAFDRLCDHRSFVYIQETGNAPGDANWTLDIDKFRRFLQDVESAV